VEPWTGEKDASKHGNISVQKDIWLTQKIIGDEDCLYLNVYSMDMKPRKKQAVMVWIHGGGYYAGAGDMNFYGPDHIVEKEVVLVTLNYRLSALGRLFTIPACLSFRSADLHVIYCKMNLK